MKKEVLKRGYITHCLTNAKGHMYNAKGRYIYDWKKEKEDNLFYWSEIYCEPNRFCTIIRKGTLLVNPSDKELSDMMEQSKINCEPDIENIYGNCVEKAENKIRLLENKRQAWSIVEKTFGIERRSPTTKESEMADKWINSWKISTDLIKEAYDRCVDNKGKYILNYIDSIIKRWHEDGIKTLQQANEEKKKNNKNNFSPSYNINDYYDSMDIFA